MNTAKDAAFGIGKQTAGLIFAGRLPAYTGITESYNGSAWTELADLATARGWPSGGTSSTSALSICMGGNAPPHSAATEEWTVPIELKSLASTNA